MIKPIAFTGGSSEQVLVEIIEGMSSGSYHGERDHESSSTLKTFIKNPREFWHYRVARDRQPPVVGYSANIGTAVHAAVLEPDSFTDVIRLAPKSVTSGRTIAFANFQAGLPDECVAICECDLDRVESMASAIWANEEAAEIFQSPGFAEASLFWKCPQTSVGLKCRFDWVSTNGSIADIKCLVDPTPAGFKRAVRRFRYDISAALYCRGRNLATGEHADSTRGFRFIVVGNEWPHESVVYRLSERTMQAAMRTLTQATREIAELRAELSFDEPWPSRYSNEVFEIDLSYGSEDEEFDL